MPFSGPRTFRLPDSTKNAYTMSIPYSFHPQLVLRTPRFPFTGNIDEATIRSLTGNRLFMEAIYLASPVLYDECLKWNAGQLTDKKPVQKLRRSLVKYFSRMSSRCTPFGLFSGCNVVPWGDAATNITLNNNRIKRHTRFDMHYLCALSQKLATLPGIKDHLRYYPNNSHYRLGDERRYVEYRYVNGRRLHQITAVSDESYLRKILQAAENGITIEEAAALLVNDEITTDDALAFVEELLEAQLLVSEMEPAITGEEFIYQVIAVLERIYQENHNEGLREIIDTLQQANRMLQEIDQQADNTASVYRAIQQCLDKLEVPYEESKLFQTDIIKESVEAVVSTALQHQLLSALSLLNKMTLVRTQENLQSFIRRYYERYEDREMPLLEVLDNESGIGYVESNAENHSPLVEDLWLPNHKDSEGTIRWGLVEKFLVNKINKAYETGAYTIDIQESELKLFTNDKWDDLPPSMAVLFRMIDARNNTVLLEMASGSSAANLLGRFAHADPAIHEMVLDITKAEQQHQPDIIYAEVIHLPESRVGNILLHPAFREYEIPYLAQSSLDKEHQIDLRDLYISVKNGRVILRSKRLNKQIIPRLSTAHNYSMMALPVYHFLCDLQCQQLRPGLNFSWGGCTFQYKFLPRVTNGNTILQPASWRLLRSDFEHLLKTPEEKLSEALQAFRKEWHLPRYIVLADGDNELLVDLEDLIMVQTWLDTVRERPGMELKEFFYPEHTAVTDLNNTVYCNQLVAALVKQGPVYKKPAPAKRTAARQVQADFSTGSEWLYFKFYCGIKSADKILADAVHPAINALTERNLVDKFFFIRYSDPGFHLRLRLHLPDLSKLGEVVQTVHRFIHPFESEGYIWKTQTDTYKRELDRYGRNTIELAEQLFCYDSDAVLKMLQHTWGDAREQIRWLWTMRAIDELLTVFDLSLPEKLSQMEMMKDAFAAEFKSDKHLKNQINNKYRKYRKQIETTMDAAQDATNEMLPILEVLKQKSALCKPLASTILHLKQNGQLEVPLDDLLFSYIHMLVNRVIPFKPRLHEMVIYDLLHQYYRAVLSKNKAKSREEKIVEAA